MFKEANGSSEVMEGLFAKLSGNELEINLARQEATIYFTKTHIADLKKVLLTDEMVYTTVAQVDD